MAYDFSGMTNEELSAAIDAAKAEVAARETVDRLKKDVYAVASSAAAEGFTITAVKQTMSTIVDQAFADHAANTE